MTDYNWQFCDEHNESYEDGGSCPYCRIRELEQANAKQAMLIAEFKGFREPKIQHLEQRIRELEQQLAEYEARDSRYWHSVKKRTDGQAQRIRKLEDLLTIGYDLVAESIADSRQYDYAARAEVFVRSAQEALADD